MNNIKHHITMETKQTEIQTKVEEWDGNLADLNQYGEGRTIETPIFIIFGEYLGYVSRFTKLAEDWCEGTVPQPHVQKVMMVEANCMFHEMKKEYGVEKIVEFYDRFYPIILEEYDEKLKKILK